MLLITKWIVRLWREGLPPESLEGYAFAAICLAAATLLRYSLDWIDGDVLPFVSYFPAIVLATIVGGLGPGIFVTTAATIVRWWAGLPASGAQVIDAVFYLLCCATTVWMVHSYRGMLCCLREKERQIELLMNELQHRRRNTLTVVQAIVQKTLQTHPADAQKINARICAWLAADQFLTGSDVATADIKDVINSALQPYDFRNIVVQGPPIALAPDLVRALALIVHELTTNAVKYGALLRPQATLFVSWIMVGQAVRISWIETGVPLDATPRRSGFGTFIFSCLLEKFGGHVSSKFRHDGLACEICFDLTPSNGGTRGRVPMYEPLVNASCAPTRPIE